MSTKNRKRSREELTEITEIDTVTKLLPPPAKRQKADTTLMVDEFKKSLAKICKEGPFMANSEQDVNWEVIELKECLTINCIKQALTTSINKIVNEYNDDAISNILSFIYVSDRILCCIEAEAEELYKYDEDINKQYQDIDTLYHTIIYGGLDSNVQYKKYNEFTFYWNKYLNTKEMAQDLFLYGGHVGIFGTSDEDGLDDKQQNDIKKKKLKSQINEMKNLINKYKNDGLLKQHSPYSVKVPDPEYFNEMGEDSICVNILEDNIDDKDILIGYKENDVDENWNDGMGLQYSNHYIVLLHGHVVVTMTNCYN